MTKPAIPDVQGSQDLRNIAIDRVGVRKVRIPVTVLTARGRSVPSVARFSMYVALPGDKKGTHMSRFIEILNEAPLELSVRNLPALVERVAARLGSPHAEVIAEFDYFVTKAAPVSGIQSMMDYAVTLRGVLDNGMMRQELEVVAPVTSLCPCSKEISEYGAHNQRSHVTLCVVHDGQVGIDELIEIGEAQASAQLYGILKRPDEKFVTEQAYDNPKFVEDLARDVAAALGQDARIASWSVTVENFESIHNHSAYAQIRGGRVDHS